MHANLLYSYERTNFERSLSRILFVRLSVQGFYLLAGATLECYEGVKQVRHALESFVKLLLESTRVSLMGCLWESIQEGVDKRGTSFRL